LADGTACPVCGCTDSETRDSRPAKLGALTARRRRRRCTRCGGLFTTYEISAAVIVAIEAALEAKKEKA
jgi:transcriptional regulator NrdR family protein